MSGLDALINRHMANAHHLRELQYSNTVRNVCMPRSLDDSNWIKEELSL